MYTKAWKIYGKDGHRQRESFGQSYAFHTYGDESFTRIFREDVLKTNDYVIMEITASDESECDRELEAQLIDGIFENVRTGATIEISPEDVPDAELPEV